MTPRDPEIRAALLARLSADPSILVRQEWSHTTAVFDVATIGAELHGFEIKSAFDSLDKLARRGSQIATYSRVCDRVTVVCAPAHVAKVRELVPSWWGILEADMPAGAVQFVDIRAPFTNPAPSPPHIAELLWSTEMRVIAARYGCGRGPKTKHAMADRLVAALGPNLRGEVFSALRARDWNAWREAREAMRAKSRERNAAMLARRAERSAQHESMAAFAERLNSAGG